jgi:hypothetical protein
MVGTSRVQRQPSYLVTFLHGFGVKLHQHFHSLERRLIETLHFKRQKRKRLDMRCAENKLVQVQLCNGINFSYRNMQGISMERITLANAPFRGQLLQRFFIVFLSQHAMQQGRLSLEGPPRNHCNSSTRTFSRTNLEGPISVDNQQHPRCSASKQVWW